jgi:hypothetical protein
MAKIIQYGAASFLCDANGDFTLVAMADANSIVGALARAGALRRELTRRVAPLTGAVAYEITTDVERNEQTLRLSAFGELPANERIQASIFQSLRGEAGRTSVAVCLRSDQDQGRTIQSEEPTGQRARQRLPARKRR